MPIFVYAHQDASITDCPDPFEEIESVHAAPLENCPRCGRPVRRVPARFATHKDVLSTSNIKEKGFTRLRRKDKGVYEAD